MKKVGYAQSTEFGFWRGSWSPRRTPYSRITRLRACSGFNNGQDCPKLEGRVQETLPRATYVNRSYTSFSKTTILGG